MVGLFGLLTMLLASPVTLAEQYETLGPWDVHYIVLNSTFLQPDIAKAYKIQRSKYNAFINISVLDSDSQKAQSVVVSGTARNLLGNTKELKFREVQEQDAIYYLAQLAFRDLETYRFDIEVRHGNNVENLRFQQKLVKD